MKEWARPNRIRLPKGISRHEVRYFQYPQGIYVVKELSERAAQQDYDALKILENYGARAVRPVGIVEKRHPDPEAEESAALITEYAPFSFSYRELISGPGFGPRRAQMLNAFAELLVELHLIGVYWGDCSLNNVLYRYDADAIETIMVDGETAEIYEGEMLSSGRREEDIQIMIENVAGGMADIAAEAGVDMDEADLFLGEDIANRYRALWAEVSSEEVIQEDESYKIEERVRKINALGFHVDEVDLVAAPGGSKVKVKLKVGGRSYHSDRLKEIVGIDALENQARQILSDLYHYQAVNGGNTARPRSVLSIQWRANEFEPMIELLRAMDDLADPVQSYCDILHHRYLMSEGVGHDVGTETAFKDWIKRGRPGYPLDHKAGAIDPQQTLPI